MERLEFVEQCYLKNANPFITIKMSDSVIYADGFFFEEYDYSDNIVLLFRGWQIAKMNIKDIIAVD